MTRRYQGSFDFIYKDHNITACVGAGDATGQNAVINCYDEERKLIATEPDSGSWVKHVKTKSDWISLVKDRFDDHYSNPASEYRV